MIKKDWSTLLHNKNSIVKIDTRGSVVKTPTIFLVYLKVNGKGGAVEWEIFRDHLAAALRWPTSGPSVQKLRFRPHHFGTTFTVVSAQIVLILKNPFFWGEEKYRRAKKKHKKFLGAAQEINCGLFLKTLILSFGWQFPDRKSETPIFPVQFWAFFALC